ncbi:alpha-galactosidase [Pedobacter heparinus]|uniref:Alpha-galactosidase n=1 Tax=Pedobacter heparinus (strain ATCC 13125 / DSM 2366 / CIP 104194 / JCM 7457 / NBRC 12017 / NCIMB 9290 / NRRL B-14731 / HIM 762-3) TaxID=485917 RepID=C6XUR7_PEDHD|nr:alpha-galactosidase [Pedobacter heparinus]ACU03917.1 glycoside hydrolase clan GH-D [Pedobacter heparinus DSM 2366]
MDIRLHINKYISCFLLLFTMGLNAIAQQDKQIIVETKHTSLIFTISSGQKLYQSYLGQKLINHSDEGLLKSTRREAYIGAGMGDLFEPAIRMVHNDGNPSLDLKYVAHKTDKQNDNVATTSIILKDPQYPVQVVLHFTAYFNEDIIKEWTEIKHNEKKPVTLTNYASSMLHFDASKYWLSQFDGDYMTEMRMKESQLTTGIKILDSKLGTRAQMYRSPCFYLSLNKPADENNGELIAGTLAWSGNFQCAFEIDQQNSLRMITGMNPYASEYKLQPGKTFETPAFIFTYTKKGKGEASRNLHRWARNYGVLDGNKPRLTLLNNWEATHMDFNQDVLVELFDGANKLGVDLFLLDDGWFGNKYPRDADKTALGDWQVDKKKLPSGIGYLVTEAGKKNLQFGIWLEPEMVSPKSELYEKHPDWILKLPNREEAYSRNQLVLDLINPKVQDFIYDMVSDLLTKNPGIAFIKWDCNRMLTNTYSPALKENQGNLFIDYNRALYTILERLRKKHPHLPIMLCAGGGGRVDYGGLKYFTEFWPSDNTDGLERVFIQWGYLNFFPALTVSSHVTSMGKQSLKFRTDVAMMGKMGYDIRVKNLTEQEIKFSNQAVKTYKKISDVIWFGDLYRLISPYEENRAVLMYVDEPKNKAVLFNYLLNFRRKEYMGKVLLNGLDPLKRYQIKEVNLLPDTKSTFPDDGKVFSGDYLMNIGLNLSSGKISPLSSSVFEIVAQN